MTATTATNATSNSARWNIEATYASLPDALWAAATPARFPAPKLVVRNAALANELGIPVHDLSSDEVARFATGAWLPPGAQPIAQAYAGHQYGHGTMLGDGRAILVGEQRTPAGALIDLHLKGAGQTPFSRRGDGRAALGPMLREYIVSEAMHALGIPTTRSLAVATTGEMIPRDGLKPGAVLVRTAASHLRVGTFEYAAALGDVAILAQLADYAIARHDADLIGERNRVQRFLGRVVERQARLIARWQAVGFVHGVMNTDNMTISGETIDYGPCAFIDAYDPESVFSSIDRFGRYRYSQQPAIAQWNLARLAESLLPLLIKQEGDESRAVDCANEMLALFPAAFEEAWLSGFRSKLGLVSKESSDGALARDLLAWMHESNADFTNTFAMLCASTHGMIERCDLSKCNAAAQSKFAAWHARWCARLAREVDGGVAAASRLRAANPALIARNHRVEEALAAAEAGDLAPIESFVAALQRPFDLQPSDARYREPAPAEFAGYRTFCGT
jgi:uncharacterized protein YdiU (UPF0061 family)